MEVHLYGAYGEFLELAATGRYEDKQCQEVQNEIRHIHGQQVRAKEFRP